jgi:hypothetical protein
MKNLMRSLALSACAAVLATAYTTVASAQISTEKSTFSLTEPMDVGGTVLQPGTYRIKVVILANDRNMLHVTDVAGTKVFAAVLATPHPIKTDETIPESRFIYFDAVDGQPKALRTWFAHDTPHGQDIIYPKRRAMEIAVAAKVPVVAIPDEVKEAEYKSVPFTVVTPEKQVKPYEAQPPTIVAETRPAPALPATASNVPLFAALGLLSVGVAVGIRVLSNRAS